MESDPRAMGAAPGRLADGSAPATPDQLFRRLHELGIPYATSTHAPVFTVEQAKAVRGDIPGGHTKNLFLRNKKGSMWLFVCQQDRPIDLNSLAERIGARRVSFGSAERLMRFLGVRPGAVTPFAVINDTSRQVRVVVEKELLEFETLNFHPLDNAMTTTIGAQDLLRFLEAENHPPLLIELG